MVQPAKKVSIIGGGAGAAQCALVLAQLGAEVSVVTPFMELDSSTTRNVALTDLLRLRPLLLRAASHPRISLHTNSTINKVTARGGKLNIKGSKNPRYVHQDLCTSCGRCSEVCSTELCIKQNGDWHTRSAIHKSNPASNAVSSTYAIDKNGIAPCKASCPLNINVTGFVSLLAKGKVDSALNLINDSAPLAGILGRVCTHSCESSCNRSRVDDPVFIRALHRYAADNAREGIKYSLKAPAGSRKEKIAIVGSGPAGLAAAWELARRGYSPVIFESHAAVGGMLATGIPRFRLPREVREREVKAIEDLGVTIKTGVTVGRDVTFSVLRERGYRAFFIAIGAHENRKLNIPGEDLDGVVDSMSLLFDLNLKLSATVGRNVVIIGGGNSAVDSARAARRRGKRNVTILYRRTAEEMTAIKEDIEEALMEGISIEYLTAPVEILGDDGRVAGVRCKRMQPGEVDKDGRHKPIPIPGSEFTIEADHVVIAIGQQPDSAQLNRKNLEVSGEDATIKVDPVTLETSIPGIFAGGDCVTGSNNVADAMAAGLRAAESIDRYLRGRSLTKGRILGTSEPVDFDIDIDNRCISPEKRAEMPYIPRAQRMGTFEETSMGLPSEVIEQEAGRCLNCSLCSECMECEKACQLGAVFHSDDIEKIEITANAIINFDSAGAGSGQGSASGVIGPVSAVPIKKPGVYTVKVGDETSLWQELSLASSVAMEVASYLNLKEDEFITGIPEGDIVENQSGKPVSSLNDTAEKESRIAVFLCSCGDSISSVIDFAEVREGLEGVKGISRVHRILQACTSEGAKQIAEQVTAGQWDRVVVAACRCCNQEQICYSCTDRRIMCRQHLIQSLPPSAGTLLDFVNIREQCAWVHKDDPWNATNKAKEMISAAVVRNSAHQPVTVQRYSIEQSVLVVGAGLSGITAAKDLAAQGYAVTLVPGIGKAATAGRHKGSRVEIEDDQLKLLKKLGVHISPRPGAFRLEGLPGNYRAALEYDTETVYLNTGAVILDTREIGSQEPPDFRAIAGQDILSRIIGHAKGIPDQNCPEHFSIRGFTIKEITGIFVIPSDDMKSPDEQVRTGREIAGRVWVYLSEGSLQSRDSAVNIDSRLCRGCGDCAALCPYIEMKSGDGSTIRAYVEPTLCIGCGACITRCPTGAIRQPLQDDTQINVMLEALLNGTRIASGVR